MCDNPNQMSLQQTHRGIFNRRGINTFIDISMVLDVVSM